MSEEKEEKSPVDRYDLKVKIRARDEKISELERFLEEAKVKNHHEFDWAGQACDLRQEIEARGKIIESLRKELPELVKANADDLLAERCHQLESECEELQKQNNLLREAAQAEDTGPDSKPALRMRICDLMDENKLLKKAADIETSVGRELRELRDLSFWGHHPSDTYKSKCENLKNQNLELKEVVAGFNKWHCEQIEKLNEPLKLGIKDKNGVEMREGDILKMPDGKHQVLSWGTEEKVFYGIGNTVTVVSAGFRIAFDGDFKASDCEIAGQSKIKMHREEI